MYLLYIFVYLRYEYKTRLRWSELTIINCTTSCMKLNEQMQTKKSTISTWSNITTPPHLAVYTSLFSPATRVWIRRVTTCYSHHNDWTFPAFICVWLTDLLLCFCCVVKTIVLMRAIIEPGLTILSTIAKPKPITYNNNKY